MVPNQQANIHENHELGTGYFVHKRIVSAAKTDFATVLAVRNYIIFKLEDLCSNSNKEF
jgi:hypothetical protein